MTHHVIRAATRQANVVPKHSESVAGSLARESVLDESRLAEIMAQLEPEWEYNIVVLGTRKVGKTSLIQTIVNGGHMHHGRMDESCLDLISNNQQSLQQETWRHHLDIGYKRGTIPVTLVSNTQLRLTSFLVQHDTVSQHYSSTVNALYRDM